MELLQPFVLHLINIFVSLGALGGSGLYLLFEMRDPVAAGHRSWIGLCGGAIMMSVIGAASGLCSAITLAMLWTTL